jgi:cbb3-type cytochrome oxidase subunit 3
MILTSSAPHTAAYDVLLLVHVGVALVGFVSLVASYVAAMNLQRAVPSQPWPAAGARYFSPGPDVAGRFLYLVPLTGAALIGSSQGAFGFGQAFVVIGIVIWLVGIVLAEAFVFGPARTIRMAVAASPTVPEDDEWRRLAGRLRWAVDAIGLLLIAAVIVMVAQP